ncbi:MAG: SufE family protein [Paracoccus sp. (in: a-proteobacteria)]|uniref:SufE family protein n=1 Tax=Paracoccus sp. TaxID=267 RepID=UPI0026E09E70|nr:SufE family protein [Paracoccus sp. (in: a-proteobacteria)]MDO5622385.1 SufE family protein [Paracoccus sp. (in: a-proteobacteria)]
MASAAFEDIVETFDFMDDWEDRYRHLIELGKAMPPMDPALQTPATKVDGCASQVWILPLIDGQGDAARFDFQGDSDALIVRGLIALLHALYAGQTLAEVRSIDASAEMARLGLAEHLSSQRSNGLRAMIQRIRESVA